MPWRLPPPHRRQLLGRQRLGHQRVVVDRHGVPAHPLDQRREGVGAECDPAGADGPAGLGPHEHAVAVLLQAGHGGALVDADAEPLGGLGQSPGQTGRVQERVVVTAPEAGQVRRGGDLGPDGVLVQERALVGLLQPRDLVRLGGHRQRAGELPRAVDPVPPDRGLDLREVLLPEPLEGVDLVGEPLLAVVATVGQRRRAEPAVATGRRPSDALRLDQHHVAAGVTLLGEEGGPEPGVPTADHHQVRRDVGGQRRPGVGARGRVEPGRRRCRVGQRGVRHRVRGKPRSTDEVDGSGQREVTTLPRV